VVGGVHATICSRQVLLDEHIDYVVRGDGEKAFVELLDMRRLEKINNLSYKQNGTILENEIRIIKNLDSLPFIDRNLDLHIKRKRVAHMMAGRGCPYTCTYCCNHILRKTYGTNDYVRYRSPANVISEIKSLLDNYHIQQVDFHDDTFTLSKKWLKEFCSLYHSINLPFVCNSRPDTFSSKVAEILSNANCDMIRIGIESGNEWLRNKILRRKTTNHQIKEACKTARDHGIKVRTFNMVGLPFETEKAVQDTYDLNKEIQPDDMHVSVFYPYPETILYRLCEQEGFLTDKNKDGYFGSGSTLNLPTLSEKQINFYYRKLKKVGE
jgi:radical SAM superfamily enzyme YgiQ (UPF0313 family)